MRLAPIALFVYNRLDNLKTTLETLIKNPEAKESYLFIFSDGPKNEKHKADVQEVRKYLRTISGFKKIEIIESETNKGLANSIISGVSYIINQYGKVIVLEDDIITSSTFLYFMNKCLNEFEKRNDIWSISGYSPKINIPDEYKDEIFINIRGSSWGWATWRNRWNDIDWEVRDAKEFLKNKNRVQEFNSAGNDLSKMLYEYLHGRIDSWAIRWYYAQFNKSKYTIFPIKSLINNSGFNYSGTHGANKNLANKLNTVAEQFIPSINKQVKENDKINKSIKILYDINFTRKIVFLLRKYGMFFLIKLLKKLIARNNSSKIVNSV